MALKWKGNMYCCDFIHETCGEVGSCPVCQQESAVSARTNYLLHICTEGHGWISEIAQEHFS
jgi:hypothetical protein